jgi:malate dehydrogenase (oxaloacetate-decarboxylating)
MKKLKIDLNNLEQCFPEHYNQEQIARGKTIFYKKIAVNGHQFYGGKIQTIPKAGVFGINWFNVWYTPGVSKISTMIRDDNDLSFELTNRGNLVAVVSDSTRVLGDGDCTPSGGLGVMEGKAFLMKYLAAVDAVPLCINSTNEKGEKDAQKIIDFVKMVEPSFGAINLEDISQPNCYQVLDTLRKESAISVWHDDAQGTACVTLAGLINALKLADKKIETCKIVLLGAGAANTTIADFIIQAGGNPDDLILFDSYGSLHKGRSDIQSKPAFYRKWDLCEKTNKNRITTIEKACQSADVMIGLSTPGPNTIKPQWIKIMADKPIVFACANPVPEIYPYAAKEAGAFIVATGRGDFPNQVNNSIGFPGILKGALLVRAKTITDNMAIAAANGLAEFAEKRGIHPDNIVPNMDESDVFPYEALIVAKQAMDDGVARLTIPEDEIYKKATSEIRESRELIQHLMQENYIKQMPMELIQKALEQTIEEIQNT